MTGFWIYMLVMALLIPFSMIGFGIYLNNGGPKEISHVIGYRTNRSMKNQETWDFAQRTCGRYWRSYGRILLPVSALCMVLFLGKSEDAIGTAGMVIIYLQLAVMICTIFLTESALKKNFDEEGRCR